MCSAVMFPLLTVSRSHKSKTHHSKTLALTTELEAYKCYWRYSLSGLGLWGPEEDLWWYHELCFPMYLWVMPGAVTDAETGKWPGACEINVCGNSTARSIVTNNRIWGGRGRILWSEGHLCESRWTNLPSKPRENCDFKNNREYVELLFLMPFNKI